VLKPRVSIAVRIVPLDREYLDAAGQQPIGMHLNQPVQGHPAQKAPGPALPDPLVRFAPAAADRSAETFEQLCRVVVQSATTAREPGDGVDNLAVYIQLADLTRKTQPPIREGLHA
jgi:hypothetical protein